MLLNSTGGRSSEHTSLINTLCVVKNTSTRKLFKNASCSEINKWVTQCLLIYVCRVNVFRKKLIFWNQFNLKIFSRVFVLTNVKYAKGLSINYQYTSIQENNRLTFIRPLLFCLTYHSFFELCIAIFALESIAQAFVCVICTQSLSESLFS